MTFLEKKKATPAEARLYGFIVDYCVHWNFDLKCCHFTSTQAHALYGTTRSNIQAMLKSMELKGIVKKTKYREYKLMGTAF